MEKKKSFEGLTVSGEVPILQERSYGVSLEQMGTEVRILVHGYVIGRIAMCEHGVYFRQAQSLPKNIFWVEGDAMGGGIVSKMEGA